MPNPFEKRFNKICSNQPIELKRGGGVNGPSLDIWYGAAKLTFEYICIFNTFPTE